MAVVPLYGVVIHQTCLDGDLAKMKELAKQVEDQLKETGDLSAAYEVLKFEISKLEKKPYTP